MADDENDDLNIVDCNSFGKYTIAPDDESQRIFELRDSLSIDIISKNIVERFKNPSMFETINYVDIFKKNFDNALANPGTDNDVTILTQTASELCSIVNGNLSKTFNASVGINYSEDGTATTDELLEAISDLYEFFVIRRYENICDYLVLEITKNKADYIERYKDVLTEAEYNDLFLTQDRKKYKNISDAILIHFIDSIISDVASQVTSGLDFFKKLVNMDLYEVVNNKLNDMFINIGPEFIVSNDHNAAVSYLSLLDNQEVAVNMRCDVLKKLLQDAPLSSDKNE